MRDEIKAFNAKKEKNKRMPGADTLWRSASKMTNSLVDCASEEEFVRFTNDEIA